MSRVIFYTIFKTNWGHFGLAGTDNALLRTYLPLSRADEVKSNVLRELVTARYDKNVFKALQNQISAYFEGAYIDFNNDIPILLEGVSPFARSVLNACRRIRYGQTMSYGTLAQESGNPKAPRAIGGAMAKNPTPLIIPCHRVVRSDGKIGGFSATGGVPLKKRLLRIESQGLSL
ncbi:MAG: methylated-DNA--[protein]-cysteine S-methyltransferase [Planctomycetota bacterium]|jgi:methylated-DNA-[protein]-cysteine S-methyltransferase